MASYVEIRDLFSDSVFRNRCTTAVVIAAGNLLAGTPTPDQQRWAAAVFSGPDAEGRKATMAVLAANNAVDVSAITGATDAQIQTNVDAVVDDLVAAFIASA